MRYPDYQGPRIDKVPLYPSIYVSLCIYSGRRSMPTNLVKTQAISLRIKHGMTGSMGMPLGFVSGENSWDVYGIMHL